MFCGNCRAQLNDSFRACPWCGAPVRRQQMIAAKNSAYYIPPAASPTPALVWGILSLSFALTPILSFLGIIFGIVAKSQAGKFKRFTGNAPNKQVLTGRKLSTAGIIIGSISTVVGLFLIEYLFYFILYLFAILSAV